MELKRLDHTKEINCDNMHSLRAAHRLLERLHDAALSLISACEEFRFEVVEADTWLFRITGGAGLSEMEDELIDIRDWSQNAYVNVRKALNRIEERGEDRAH